jgi:hypothetical protein
MIASFANLISRSPTCAACLSRRVHAYNHKNDLALVWSGSFKNL